MEIIAISILLGFLAISFKLSDIRDHLKQIADLEKEKKND